MEEKERYEIHRYTLQGNEKISFNDYTEHICEHYDFGFEKIKPFNQRIQDLLNQQNKRIKELESKLRVSNSSNASLSLDYIELKKRYDSQEELLTHKLAENSRLTLENQQLKKQNRKLNLEAQRYYEDAYCNNFQNQTAISELEKVKEYILLNDEYDEEVGCNIIETFDLLEDIRDRIEELKGEE